MRRRLLVSMSAAATLVLGLTVGAPASHAVLTTCDGTFTGATFANLVVPENGKCSITDTTVNGSATIGSNGSLETCRGSIAGSVTGSNVYLKIEQTPVGGSISVAPQGQQLAGVTVACSTAPGSTTYSGIICARRVGGSITVHDGGSSTREFTIGEDCGFRPQVGNSVSILRNQLPVSVEDTDIAGSLICQGNNPPAEQAANTVGGTISGCVAA